MIFYQDECVCCDYCVHCGKKNTLYMICDNCGEAVTTLYRKGKDDYCSKCFLETADKVIHWEDVSAADEDNDVEIADAIVELIENCM